MPVRLCSAVLFLLVAVLTSSLVQAAIPLSERQALIAFYNATNGPHWFGGSNWLGSWGTEGTWTGVTVADGHVTELVLRAKGLAGRIPPEIGDLTYLQKLDLFGSGDAWSVTWEANRITGLPAEIGRLKRLKTLDLTSNGLASLPPEVGELESLEELLIGFNRLEQLPDTLTRLHSLRALDLSANSLADLPNELWAMTWLEILRLAGKRLSTVPPGLWKLVNLKELNLSSNLLTELPADIGRLVNLETLRIAGNSIGQIPPELAGLPQLRVLDLSYNKPAPAGLGALKQLTELYARGLAEVPREVGNISGLKVLDLSYGTLTSLPPEFGNLRSLEKLRLTANSLEEIPPFIGQLVNLVQFEISSNRLSAPIPPGIGNLHLLKVLQISGGRGELPPEIGNMASLEWLSISGPFSGEIPASFGNLKSLRYLWLGGKFSGISGELGRLVNLRELWIWGDFASIPPELGKLTSLERLTLYGQFAAIPGSLGSLQALKQLDLTSTAGPRLAPELGELSNLEWLEISGGFTGEIPPTFSQLTNLQRFYASGNRLSGSLPPEMAGMTSLSSLDLSGNLLEGLLPVEIARLPQIAYLNLANNLLEGPLPPELGEMTQLGSLYLNGNRFTGTIPVALARMSNLSMLNLSNNRLEGRLPAELAELVKKSKPCWLTLSSNKLSGPIPDEFRDVAGYQPYVDFSYNGLYANSAGVFDFIGRHHMKDFASTQSAGPFSLTVQSVSGNSVQLAWDPISYAADNGGYEVLYRKGSDGPLAVYAMTPDKTVNSVTVAGLEAGTTYSFILRTITYPHAKNQNTVVGEPARFVTATTAQTAEAWFPFAPAVGQSAGLAMTNPGTSEMKVQVSALNNAGTLLPLPANPASFAIPPGRHLAAMTPQIFGSEPLAPAWIRVAADQTLVSLGMIQGPGYLDGIPGFTRLHKVLYFPRVYGSSIGGQPPPPVTTISLVNPGEGLVQVSLEVRGHEVAAAPVTRAIPPRGQLWETVDSLFPGQSFGQVYLVATVTEGEGVAGLAMVNAGGGRSLYIVPGQPISGANRLFSAQVASGPGIRTSFRLVNASAEPRTVTVRLVQEDGSTVEPLVLTVPGGGLTEGEVGATFQLDSARLSAASLDVTADAGGILGDVVVYQFGRPGIPGLEYASELALDNRLARRAYLGYVANSPGIFTGLAFYNPGSEDADVTVDVYSEDGTLKGTTSFELPAGGRLARTVPELVPAAAGWSRGYIYIRSTAPLALQELFVDERLQYLSTVPAVIL